MESPAAHARNADQATYWNGPAGRRWLERQETLDTILAPVTRTLFDRARVVSGEHVIDIGCGCGETTAELAQRVGPSGEVLGVDISAPMLARARERAPANLPVRFALADATVHAFEPGRADLLFSRFGVMFFADPPLSFRNLRSALRRDGRLTFVCWREPRRNPWMMLPLQEAYKHVPRLPEVGPEEPGPFAFAREERVRRILDEAGFAGVSLEAVDLVLDIAAGGGLEAAVTAAMLVGPVSRALEGQSAEAGEAVAGSIRLALASVQRGDTVPLGASVWIVTARNR
jgi:ubiquinone/menaquinone biosynthesis C-methylase UbiE